MSQVDFILASASPRRRELLTQIGARFEVRALDIDESWRPGETPSQYVQRLAREKAGTGIMQFGGALPVMGADTTVVLDGAGEPMGKPRDEEQGVAMLMALAGRTHSVLSAVAIASEERIEHRLSATRVRFCPLDEARCRRYWRSGEPLDKAGGYAIQGLGAVFVEAIEGSYSGVVGLPLAQTRELLDEFGLVYWQ